MIDAMNKTPEQITYNMKQVHNKDSKIELMLRKELWKRGMRYRKNVNRITGHPDIAFVGKKIAVFCDSEFWHGYNWEERKNDFKSNRDFWLPKIERNMARTRIAILDVPCLAELKSGNITANSLWRVLWIDVLGHGKKK